MRLFCFNILSISFSETSVKLLLTEHLNFENIIPNFFLWILKT